MYGRQRSRSAGVGRFSGGAQRTAAVTQTSASARPSSRARETGWLASPARHSAANRKSPERSPVNTRPVRFAPCAAGARPRIAIRACGSPKPATGRPQYRSPAYAARFSRATCSRQATSRGQRRQPSISLGERRERSVA